MTVANKLDVQIANIQAMLEQLLKQTQSSDTMGPAPCPTCGCTSPDAHGDGPKGRGKIIMMIGKKKKIEDDDNMDPFPSLLKDVLGAFSGKDKKSN